MLVPVANIVGSVSLVLVIVEVSLGTNQNRAVLVAGERNNELIDELFVRELAKVKGNWDIVRSTSVARVATKEMVQRFGHMCRSGLSAISESSSSGQRGKEDSDG